MMRPPKGSKDQLANLRKVYHENKHEPIVAVNLAGSSSSFLIPFDKELVKALFRKEYKYLKKTPFRYHNIGKNMFTESNHKALERRAIFSEFFGPENVKRITPLIHSIFYRHIKNLKEKFWDSSRTKTYEF